MKYLIIFLLQLSMLNAFGQTTNWFTDKDEAIEFATANKAQILMVFSGSDWCRPCMKFKKDILENQAFAEFGSDRLAVLYLDFPAKKKNKLSEKQTVHNEALAEKFNKSGLFPNVLLVNNEFEILSRLTYEGQDADYFIGKIQRQ